MRECRGDVLRQRVAHDEHRGLFFLVRSYKLFAMFIWASLDDRDIGMRNDVHFGFAQ